MTPSPSPFSLLSSQSRLCFSCRIQHTHFLTRVPSHSLYLSIYLFPAEINSIYYDDKDLTLYHTRLAKEEGSILIRFRWYDQLTDLSPVFIERKVHHEDWIGEKSVKERTSLAARNILDYIHGGLRGAGDFAKKYPLYNDVQDQVVGMKLIPTCRTHYQRIAFQLGTEGNDDDSVRLSLDTQV